MDIYNPFQKLDFRFDKCFLTGENADFQRLVIHPFLQESGGLSNQSIQMLDEQKLPYKALILPCDKLFFESYIQELDNTVIAGLQSGYEKLIEIDDDRLFLWAGMISYGLIYNELFSVLKNAQENNEVNSIPQGLVHKFKNLHLMLQKLHLPIVFDGFKPYSLMRFELNEKVPFSFRNDINSLTFSMKFNNVGLIMVLQDNGYTKNYLHNSLKKVEAKALTLLQFEELSAQFYYSSYLMNKLPEYDILKTSDTFYLDARPLAGLGNKRVFDVWQQKVYAQVLESFWKPWGYSMFEILRNPEQPMSFL